MSIANKELVCTSHWRAECSCVVPAYAAQCVRPLLGGEGAGEGEPMSMYRSPAREVEEAVENEKNYFGNRKKIMKEKEKQGEKTEGNQHKEILICLLQKVIFSIRGLQ